MSLKILLIEDNPDHALLAERALQKAKGDYQVDTVNEAQQGLDRIFQEDYDLVLCDYRLPSASALDILQRIRDKGKDLPFIVVTSAGNEKIAVEAMQRGAYDYVVKDQQFQDSLPVIISRSIERYREKKVKERLEKELKESNVKLKQLYTMKSDFTSMVSHELRTPLTAIKEGIALVLDGTAGQLNADQQECLDTAKRNVDRLNRLINDVLDFSKLESKRLVFKMCQYNINKLINEVVSIHKPVAEQKGLYLKTELDAQIPDIEFDPDRINQVLNNLINNSIKFTRTGGITVCASLDKAKKIVTVSVRDTGEGIKKEDVSKLFRKFQQLDRAKGGTGLGLAISKEIVEQHDGRLWVESECGKGAQFKFTLPSTPRYKILVVDDEEIVLDTCEQILTKRGYHVLRTQEGLRCIQMAQADKPDLIMLDIRLKDTTGYEVIDQIKNSKETKGIPILVITGHKEEVEKIKSGKENLSLPWMTKPFEVKEFLSKVKSLLGLRKKE